MSNHIREGCSVTYERGNYPYHCQRRDDEPDALIATCSTHLAWWVVDEAPSITIPEDLLVNLSLHSFDGGLWQFHAVDDGDDMPVTHRMVAV